jgi:hypothetical protein
MLVYRLHQLTVWLMWAYSVGVIGLLLQGCVLLRMCGW